MHILQIKPDYPVMVLYRKCKVYQTVYDKITV